MSEDLAGEGDSGRPRHAAPALALVAVAAAGSLLAGCSGDSGGGGTARCGPAPSADVSQADLYGSYSGPHGARLELTAVGGTSVTFSVKNWPKEEGPGILTEKVPTFDGAGVWKLLNAPGEDGEVGLAFDGLDTSARGATVTELRVGEDDGHTVLFARLGDPDVCRVLTLS
ncbi:hypothetical protein [Streptomyces sp. NBC_01423]|uniref:hypothetical protein n=1 Tax=Streptomyces sp. NBC_01423 TaxID=2903860 RepID=UPI002E296226|nr:hypothetical protein [Streptomyces sp. NBC_01423]